METKLSIIKKYILGIGIPIIFILTVWWAKDNPDIVRLVDGFKQGFTQQKDEKMEDVHLDRLCLIILIGFLLMVIIPPQIIILLWVVIFICAALFGWPFTFKEIEFAGYVVVLLLFFGGATALGILGEIVN